MLTEIQIKALKPRERSYKVSAGRGMYLEVFPNGSKLWRYRYQVDGKETRKSLGTWPYVSLRTAREINERRRFERLTGQVTPPVKPSGPTVADLCASWKQKFLPKMAPNTVLKMSVHFSKHILPSIGALNAAELTSETVLRDLLHPIEAAGHREQAHRIKGTLSRILRFGMAQGFLDRDVTAPLAGALSPKSTRHMPTILDPRRVGRLMLDIRNYNGGPVVGLALRMLPYVFVRPGELRNAEWGEFDMAERIWRIPAERMKMKTTHLVPLSNQVVALLERLRTFTGEGRYLFPGRYLRSKPMSDMAINAALRYLGYGRDEIVGHGFRGMASSLLHERGYNRDWIERQLAHVERNGVRAAYNHAEYWPERCKMMQDWADYLDSLTDAAALPGEV
jgi:integrase